MSKRSAKFSAPLTVFLCVVMMALGCVVGFVGAALYDASTHESDHVTVNGELEIHFLELGNKYTGDCTYIKAGDVK